MEIEEFEFDFGSMNIDDKIDEFKDGVIYKHSEGDYYAKIMCYEYGYSNGEHVKTGETFFSMCLIPKEIITLLEAKHKIALGAFQDIEDLKAQYKERLQYDVMKAQMWCDIVREKGVEDANRALMAFDKTFGVVRDGIS